MKNYIHTSDYFYGHKISEYGLKKGYIDYRTLAAAFDAVLNNNIIEETAKFGLYWDTVNGSEIQYYNRETGDYIEESEIEDWDNIGEQYSEIYQYFIISDRGYEILSELTDEIVFYNEDLDMYVWGVTHWGTAGDYVLTDIEIEIGKET